MRKTIFLLMVLTIVSKVSGFLRDLTLAYFYGASETSDVFLLSISIPTVVFGVVAAGISTGYIPLYSRITEQSGDKAGLEYTNNLINILLISTTFIVILALIFTEQLVKVFAIGFQGETLALAVMFTRFSIFGIYFTLITRILSAYLNYKKMFAIPSLIGIPMNLVLIVAIILSSRLELIYILAVANVVALFIQFLIILFFAYRYSFRFQRVLRPGDEHIKEMAVLAFPVILGSGVGQLNRLIDRSLASWISIGGISSINYASTLNVSFLGIFVSSFVTVFYPDISKKAARGDMAGLKHTLNQTILGVLTLIIPATIGAMIFAEPIVRFLFDRGAFDETAVTLTTSAFFFYSLGLAGTGVNLILTRTFYALQDTKTPMLNSTIGVSINIALNFLLAPILGIGGLALATSLSALMTVLLLTRSLRRKFGRLNLTHLIPTALRITAAAFFAAASSYGFLILMNPFVGSDVSLVLAFALMAVLYISMLLLMGVDGVRTFLEAMLNKFKKKQK
ncbi:murein biosynthesis integral membrane protein MurJ [Salinicoccus sp. CNSTN-B1]